MRNRGDKFWLWADATLSHRYHDEELADGTRIDVQVRLSRTGETQLFIGVYNSNGVLIVEEIYDSLPGETLTRAQAWGLNRAKSFALPNAAD
ncbi:hypothetical protein D3C77_234660 [compost metagenome]